MAGYTSVNPRRIAETLLSAHLAEMQEEIQQDTIRRHVVMLASNGLITADQIDALAEEVGDLMSDAAAEDRIAVTIREG